MTPDPRAKTLCEIDELIEQTERACEEYELLQMEIMTALARAKAIHSRLLANKAELVRELEERSG
jgi:hypothetical protein